MKKFKFLLGALVVMGLMTSCNNDDDFSAKPISENHQVRIRANLDSGEMQL